MQFKRERVAFHFPPKLKGNIKIELVLVASPKRWQLVFQSAT